MTKRLALLLLFALLVIPPATAADGSAGGSGGFSLKGLGPSGAQVSAVLIPAAILIGVGIYFLARHPRITGCVTSGPGGLDLHTEGSSPRTYALAGRTAALPPNQRVKVSGKRGKQTTTTAERTFTVESLKHTYGPCRL